MSTSGENPDVAVNWADVAKFMSRFVTMRLFNSEQQIDFLTSEGGAPLVMAKFPPFEGAPSFEAELARLAPELGEHGFSVAHLTPELFDVLGHPLKSKPSLYVLVPPTPARAASVNKRKEYTERKYIGLAVDRESGEFVAYRSVDEVGTQVDVFGRGPNVKKQFAIFFEDAALKKRVIDAANVREITFTWPTGATVTMTLPYLPTAAYDMLRKAKKSASRKRAAPEAGDDADADADADDDAAEDDAAEDDEDAAEAEDEDEEENKKPAKKSAKAPAVKAPAVKAPAAANVSPFAGALAPAPSASPFAGALAPKAGKEAAVPVAAPAAAAAPVPAPEPAASTRASAFVRGFSEPVSAAALEVAAGKTGAVSALQLKERTVTALQPPAPPRIVARRPLGDVDALRVAHVAVPIRAREASPDDGVMPLTVLAHAKFLLEATPLGARPPLFDGKLTMGSALGDAVTNVALFHFFRVAELAAPVLVGAGHDYVLPPTTPLSSVLVGANVRAVPVLVPIAKRAATAADAFAATTAMQHYCHKMSCPGATKLSPVFRNATRMRDVLADPLLAIVLENFALCARELVPQLLLDDADAPPTTSAAAALTLDDLW